MAFFMDYEGIKGDVTAKGFEDMIAVKHFGFSVSREISMKAGEMSKRGDFWIAPQSIP